MGKFSDYLDSMKNQTDTLREVVSEKSGVDCSELSIKGVADVVKDIQTGGKDPVLQEKSVSPAVFSQEVKADDGYDGLSKVNIGAVTSEIDVNILPNNIRSGVSILGVQGNLSSDKPDQTKTVTPTTSRQEVVADTGYELGRVIVEAVEPSDYYKDEESVSVTPTTESQKITPTTNKVFNEVNVGAVTSAIDSNIVADNIKKDVTILGVTGTLEEGGAEDLTEELTAQDTALTSLESAVDKLPEPKKDMLQARIDSNNSCKYLFYYYDGTNVDFAKNLDTSRVTTMRYMYGYAQSLKTIHPIDTRNATDMSSMFHYDITLVSVPELKSSSCTTMDDMFNYCTALITISLLDMIKTTSASKMLTNCKALKNITLKNIRISLQIGNGTSWGHLLTDESIINTAKELWDNTDNALGGTRTLTLSTPSNARLDAIYVKLVEATADMIANDEYITNKKPCVVCESTDEGAMTLREYILSKNWTIA